MDQPVSDSNTTATTLAVIVLMGLVIAYFAGISFYAHSQDAIELTPKHLDVMQNCLCIGLLAAFASAVLVGLLARGSSAFRLVLVVLAAVLGFAAAFQVSIAMTNVAQMRADFPADKTQAYAAQWPITEADRVKTRKQGTSYGVHTPTLNAPLDIHAQDFNFMRANAAPEDISPDGNQIGSHGRFCATVALQRAGEAVRLMVAPGHPLPAGSIGLCSQSAGN